MKDIVHPPHLYENWCKTEYIPYTAKDSLQLRIEGKNNLYSKLLLLLISYLFTHITSNMLIRLTGIWK